MQWRCHGWHSLATRCLMPRTTYWKRHHGPLLEDLCPPWQQHRGMALYTTVAMLGRLGALMLGSMPTLPFIGGPDAHMRMLLLASGAMLILCATACVYAAR